MIYVDRTLVKKPPILDSERMKSEFEKMKRFHSDQEKGSKYKRYKFTVLTNPSVRKAVKHLFNGKCAYCESRIIEVSNGDIDLFRPKSGAMNIDGSFDPNHYWWLAYEWSNLYLSCSVCNQRYKRNYFPVKGERIPVLGDLSEEYPLLLDPCKYEDFIEQHIGFKEEQAIPLTEKGETTIKILGLNRKELLASRKRELQNLHDAIQIVRLFEATKGKENKGYDKRLIDRLIAPESPYLACKWSNHWKDLMDINPGYICTR